MSFGRLEAAIKRTNNPTVVGLDPSFDKLPEFIKSRALEQCGPTPEAAEQAVLSFNTALIDALCDIVPAVKPQCAYYERIGWQGMRALEATISYAHSKGMYVIADAKRGDIGSTAQAYAEAFLGGSETGGRFIPAFGADSVTVNGYLGSDGVKPFADLCKKYDKGIFVLVKTSNPSSCEVQDLVADGGPLYERMGELCADWGGAAQGYSDIGAVIGATWPEQLGLLRRKLAHTFFLVPGYGAQGGGADDAAPAFDSAGGGAVVNSSRAVIYAYKKEGCREEDFAGAARREALRMKDALNAAIAKKSM
jgi:orotidine-5'-phosphate decarboxylase